MIILHPVASFRQMAKTVIDPICFLFCICLGLSLIIGLTVLSWQFSVFNLYYETTNARVTNFTMINSTCECTSYCEDLQFYPCYRVKVIYLFDLEETSDNKTYSGNDERDFDDNIKQAQNYINLINNSYDTQIWYSRIDPNENYLNNPHEDDDRVDGYVVGIITIVICIFYAVSYILTNGYED